MCYWASTTGQARRDFCRGSGEIRERGLRENADVELGKLERYA